VARNELVQISLILATKYSSHRLSLCCGNCLLKVLVRLRETITLTHDTIVAIRPAPTALPFARSGHLLEARVAGHQTAGGIKLFMLQNDVRGWATLGS